MKKILLGMFLSVILAGYFCVCQGKSIAIHNWDGCASCWAALMEDSGHRANYYQY